MILSAPLKSIGFDNSSLRGISWRSSLYRVDCRAAKAARKDKWSRMLRLMEGTQKTDSLARFFAWRTAAIIWKAFMAEYKYIQSLIRGTGKIANAIGDSLTFSRLTPKETGGSSGILLGPSSSVAHNWVWKPQLYRRPAGRRRKDLLYSKQQYNIISAFHPEDLSIAVAPAI